MNVWTTLDNNVSTVQAATSSDQDATTRSKQQKKQQESLSNAETNDGDAENMDLDDDYGITNDEVTPAKEVDRQNDDDSMDKGRTGKLNG